MGFIERIREKRTHPGQPAEWFLNMFRQSADSGVNVTHQTALQSSAVFACVRVLAETVASLPLIFYRRLERGKKRADSHPLYQILHDLPNPEMTGFEFWETLMGHLALWGNGYAEIEYGGDGHVRGLWPLRPDKTQPVRGNGRLAYLVTLPTGRQVVLPFERVMHLRGLGYDGVRGYDPISLARQAVGLAIGTEKFGNTFYGNGTQLGTVLEHPGKLSAEAHDRLKKSVEMRHQGLDNAHRLMILEEGMAVKSIGIPPENAQFLETRKFSVVDIARFWRMQPHKIAHLEQATFSNIEHQSIEFVTDTIRPWLVRIEQAIYRDLLTPTERRQYFAEHLVDALLRGDIKSRFEAYAQGRQNGWLSANDIREMENQNPIVGGDVYLVPLNMIPANQVGQEPPPEEPPEPEPPANDPDDDDPDDEGGADRSGPGRERRDQAAIERRARQENVARGRQRLARSYQRVIGDAAGRVLRREIADIRRALKKFLGQRNEQEFGLWLQEFYNEHRDFWIRQLLPVLLTYAEQVGVSVAEELGGEPTDPEEVRAFIDAYVEKLAARQVGTSIGQLRNVLEAALAEGTDPAEAIEERLGRWEDNRTEQVSRDESFQALNAFVWIFYVSSGVTRMRWVARGENCPFCDSINGKVVGIRQFFITKGEELNPEEADSPLPIRSDIRHPPIHKGCNCSIVAERS